MLSMMTPETDRDQGAAEPREQRRADECEDAGDQHPEWKRRRQHGEHTQDRPHCIVAKDMFRKRRLRRRDTGQCCRSWGLDAEIIGLPVRDHLLDRGSFRDVPVQHLACQFRQFGVALRTAKPTIWVGVKSLIRPCRSSGNSSRIRSRISRRITRSCAPSAKRRANRATMISATATSAFRPASIVMPSNSPTTLQMKLMSKIGKAT